MSPTVEEGRDPAYRRFPAVAAGVFPHLLFLLLAGGSWSRSGAGPAPAGAQETPTVEASALLEKTLFRIDVARLNLQFGGDTAARLEALLEAAGPETSLADSVAEVAIHSRDATARLTFLWGIGFDRFMENVQRSVEVAREAGLLDPGFARSLSDSLPGWYAPIRERGVKDGDTMTYRIRGDTMRIVFRTRKDSVMVDQRAVGRQSRLSVLGGFLSAGSEFREGLLDSLLDRKLR
ncbi:MAG: hypothetical protein R6T96_12735 [Longimicrobiales bacterium]